MVCNRRHQYDTDADTNKLEVRERINLFTVVEER